MSETTQDLLVIQPQLPIGSLEAYIQRINDIPILTVKVISLPLTIAK